MIRFILILTLSLLTSSAWGQTVTFPDSGTVINHLAKLTGTIPSATNLSTTDITAIGIASTFPDPITRQVAITTSGIAFCAFDGAVTVDDYFGASATNAGQCADVGASPTAQTLGQILGTGPANTYRVILSASVVSGLSGATKGEPLVGTSAGSAASSAAYIDATQFAGADAAAKISAAWTALVAISSSGGTVDARGLVGAQTATTSMFTNYPKNCNFSGTLLINATITTDVTQVLPCGARIEGPGGHPLVNDTLTPPFPGAVIQASNSFPSGSATVNSASESSNTGTYTLASALPSWLTQGAVVSVTGMLASGYNSMGTVATINAGAKTFTMILPTTGLGASSQAGAVTPGPVVAFGSSDGGGGVVPQGQGLLRIGVDCLPPNAVYNANSIGIQVHWAEENSGWDNVMIDGCHIAVDLEGPNTINSGPFNNTIIHQSGISDANAVGVIYGSNAAGNAAQPNRGFHGLTIDAEGNAVQPATAIQIDDDSIYFENVHIESFVTGIEVGANHSAYGLFVNNLNCLATTSPAYPMTTCIDLSSANTVVAMINGLTSLSSNITNMLVDHGTNGRTLTQAAQSALAYYARDLNGMVRSSETTSSPDCLMVDTKCIVINEEFFTNQQALTTTNGVSINFQNPWTLYFNVGTPGGQTLGEANHTDIFPNLGQLGVKGPTVTASGDTFVAALGDMANGTMFGALGSQHNWETNFNVLLDATTSRTVRVGFCDQHNAANAMCQGSTTNSITVRYDTAQNDTGWVGETCNAAACNATASLCTIDTNWHTLRIRSLANGTIRFSCDGGAELTSATDVPSAAMAGFVYWMDDLSSTQHELRGDFFQFKAWNLAR